MHKFIEDVCYNLFTAEQRADLINDANQPEEKFLCLIIIINNFQTSSVEPSDPAETSVLDNGWE